MTDPEAVESPDGKHGIDSYVSPTKTTSTDDNTTTTTTGGAATTDQHQRPHLVSSNNAQQQRQGMMLRSQDHLNMAQSKNVEGTNKSHGQIRAEHIVKIFTTDDDFIEVSPEQVERVKTMHESIEGSVNFTFNYNTLLLVASILAGLGLVSDSTTTVIASMLVSPIMGPVVGLAYGTTINDWKLVRLSLRNECISLIVCIVIGLILGAICGVTDLADEWPTDEMNSRATLQNFYVALPVAFFSGLGVAVSLLEEQTASLVGVAISASLLPPAVNAGVYWIWYGYMAHGKLPDTSTLGLNNVRDKGLLSLFLTLANILLIWISSMLMFRMKEVLPIDKKVFWEDLGIARKIYRKRALLEVVEVNNNDNDNNTGDAARPTNDMMDEQQEQQQQHGEE